MSNDRVWFWVQSPSGRESAFTRVRHIVPESDPYSGFGATACGKACRDSGSGGVTDSDLDDPTGWYQQNNIPTDRCPICDKRTRRDS